MFTAAPSLADLAASSGLEPRTIRSWVAQGLLPPPLSRGPAARYPTDTLPRLLAIRTMRDALGMSLTDIRKELLVASPEQIAAYASRAETVAKPSQATGNPASSALDYIANLRARAPQPAPVLTAEATPPRPRTATGIEALERRLGHGRPEPARKARAEEWLRIPVTPDIELTVRGPLDAEQRTRLERCADLIRDILLGRDR